MHRSPKISQREFSTRIPRPMVGGVVRERTPLRVS